MKRQDKYNAFMDTLKRYAAERWQAYRDSDDKQANRAEYRMQILIEHNPVFCQIAERRGILIQLR